jgi:hypothetical protein
MGATVHEFDPDATPEQKAATVAKSMQSIAPVAGADPRRLRPEAAGEPGRDLVQGVIDPHTELKVGGGQKVETTTSAAVATKDAVSSSDAVVPGAIPDAQVGLVPDWYRVGWAQQGARKDLGLDSQQVEQQEGLGRFVSDMYFANLFYNAAVIVFAVLATHFATRLGGGWGIMIVILGICAKCVCRQPSGSSSSLTYVRTDTNSSA